VAFAYISVEFGRPEYIAFDFSNTSAITLISYILRAEIVFLNNYLVDDIYIEVIILFPVAYILLNSGKNIKFDRFIGGLAYPFFSTLRSNLDHSRFVRI